MGRVRSEHASTATPSTRPRPTAWPAARAAATRRRWRRAWSRWRSAPTPAARSGIPAAGCGVVGLKTALGAVPTEGVFPLAASFDTVGPMARTVADCALAHAVLTATEVPGARARRPARRRADRPPGPRAPRRRRPSATSARWRTSSACARSAPTSRELSLPVPESDTWAVFYADTAAAHAATFPSRRDEYGPLIRAKLDHAHHGDRRAGARGPPGARRVARRGRPRARRRPRARADAGLRRAAARRRRRARRAAALLGLRARLQLPGLARDRDRDRCSSPAATPRSSSAPHWRWSATAGCVSVDPCARPASPT